jgi:hypothetical protein
LGGIKSYNSKTLQIFARILHVNYFTLTFYFNNLLIPS